MPCSLRSLSAGSFGVRGGDKAQSAAETGGLVGNPAPDFHVKTVTEPQEKIVLQDLRGKVVLVDFWGTFCAPCKKSFPKLQALNRKYGG